MPGRPEGFHHQSPTDPYVNLSIHTALVSHPLDTSRFQTDTESIQFLPVSRLTVFSCELTHPLRSNSITEPSTLLQDDPPLIHALVLSPFVFFTYKVFPSHHVQDSHVP